MMKELSLNILDITQNSIKAKATNIEIAVKENSVEDLLTIIIKDNGTGMSKDELQSVCSPFYTTRATRRVGLGIPFFKMASEMAGGNFVINSDHENGTSITATFMLSNIDRMPLGDINGTISLLINCNPTVDFVFNRTINDKSFTLNTSSLRDVLGDVPLNTPDVSDWIKDYLNEQTELICGGASNEKR